MSCGIDYKNGTQGVSVATTKNVLGSYYNYTYSDYKLSDVQNSLNSKLPVIIEADNNNSVYGHTWIIDGYNVSGISTDYNLVYFNGTLGEFFIDYSFTTLLTENVYSTSSALHMNWGLGGVDNGYYSTYDSSWSANGAVYKNNKKTYINVKKK